MKKQFAFIVNSLLSFKRVISQEGRITGDKGILERNKNRERHTIIYNC